MISAPDAPLFLVLPLPAGEALFPFAPPPVFGAFLPELSSPKISSASAAAFAAAAFSTAAVCAGAVFLWGGGLWEGGFYGRRRV